MSQSLGQSALLIIPVHSIMPANAGPMLIILRPRAAHTAKLRQGAQDTAATPHGTALHGVGHHVRQHCRGLLPCACSRMDGPLDVPL